MSNKEKAFTLTELLIVVIVIGILSAVVLPKFNKVVETRKTTEAEEVMAAIRTEQEYRCSLNKRYTTNFTSFIENGDVKLTPVSGETSKAQSKNFTYTLTNAGVTAKSTDPNKNYTLEMPSFADGRISCTGNYCHQLNKNYLPYEELIAKADYANPLSSCATVINCVGETMQECTCSDGGTGGTQMRNCDMTSGTWSGWSECTGCEFPACDDGTTESSLCSCPGGLSGTKTHTCIGGTWGDWSGCSCDVPQTQECEGPSTTSCCDGRGTKTRTCSNGEWSDWGSCEGCTCDESSRPKRQRCDTAWLYPQCDETTGEWYFETCEGSLCGPGTQTTTCHCDNGSTGHKTRSCNPATGHWDNWGECTGCTIGPDVGGEVEPDLPPSL